MATTEYTGTITSGGSVIGSYTRRYTYTITNYEDRAVITITKAEEKTTNPGTTVGGTIGISYRDSSSGWVSTSFSYGKFTISSKNTYVTFWTGSKVVTTYKTTSTYNVSVAGAPIPISTPTQYSVTYTGEGSNFPTSQIKYYGIDLLLSIGEPTRNGYKFVNWKSNENPPKYYSKAATYTANQSVILTAQWAANSYKVIYSPNGGEGAIESQQKVYDVPANFNSGANYSRKEIYNSITREYILNNWNTSLDGSGTSYALSSAIPNIVNDIYVYAIWELKYFYPYLSNLHSYRTSTSSISDKTRSDKGEYIYISFDFIGYSNNAGETYAPPSCVIKIDDDIYTPSLSFSTINSGVCEFKPSTKYSYDNPHNILITLYDPNEQEPRTRTFISYDYITSAIYPIDLYSNEEIYNEITNPTGNPSEQQWYELVNDEYVLTSDSTVVSGKVYYEKGENEVYMGIMHPYKEGKILMLPDTTMDGNLDIDGDINFFNGSQFTTSTAKIETTDAGILKIESNNNIIIQANSTELTITTGGQVLVNGTPIGGNIPTETLEVTYVPNAYVGMYYINGLVCKKIGNYVNLQIYIAPTSAALPANTYVVVANVAALAIAQPAGSILSCTHSVTTNGRVLWCGLLDNGDIRIHNVGSSAIPTYEYARTHLPYIIGG